MDKPLFNENDIQIFFKSDQPAGVKVEKNQTPSPASEMEGTFEIEFEPDMEPKTPQIESGPIPIKPKTLEPGPSNPRPTYMTPRPVDQINRRVYPAPVPPPGALPQVQTSYVNNYEYERPSALPAIAKFLGIFALIFVLSFIFLNGPALWKGFNYFTVTNINNTSYASTAPMPASTVASSRLIIPEIKVDAPIIWNSGENDVIQNLEKGVVHYQNTALPGQIGNIFITGHSSYYPWASGDYKDIFALLGKLETGDKIYLQYQGQNFVYNVTGSKTVSPDDLTVLNTTPGKTLTLMTCVPVGTNLKRLVVTADQIL